MSVCVCVCISCEVNSAKLGQLRQVLESNIKYFLFFRDIPCSEETAVALHKLVMPCYLNGK